MNAEQLHEIVDEVGVSEIVFLQNAVCDKVGYGDDMIYSFDDPENFFEDMFSSKWEAVRATLYGEVHYFDDFVRFNGYANLETLSDAKAEEYAMMTIFDNEELWEDLEYTEEPNINDLINWIY